MAMPVKIINSKNLYCLVDGDVRFEFTKSVPISQVDLLKTLMLGIENVLGMNG